jgi:hypothetical protein
VVPQIFSKVSIFPATGKNAYLLVPATKNLVYLPSSLDLASIKALFMIDDPTIHTEAVPR